METKDLSILLYIAFCIIIYTTIYPSVLHILNAIAAHALYFQAPVAMVSRAVLSWINKIDYVHKPKFVQAGQRENQGHMFQTHEPDKEDIIVNHTCRAEKHQGNRS